LSIVRASADDAERLKELVPKDDYRGAFLKLTRNLAPTGKNFSRLEIRGPDHAAPVALAPENRKSISHALKPAASVLSALSIEETEVELTGVLRAVHLDKDWLELLVDENPLHIDGVSETIDDLIGPMVNRTVIVRARRKGSLYRFIDIESGD
jgi:hypothetical protein